MRAICQEFERQEREGGGSEGAGGGGGERILQLMQQVQYAILDLLSTVIVNPGGQSKMLGFHWGANVGDVLEFVFNGFTKMSVNCNSSCAVATVWTASS